VYNLYSNFKHASSPTGIIFVQPFLTDSEIDVINDESKNSTFQKAKVYSESYDTNANQKNKRDSHIKWIEYKKHNKPLCDVFSKIYSQIIEVNKNNFHFDLTDVESFQYTSYSTGDFYNKHMDVDSEYLVGNTQRKLSFTIQLTDPDEYTGGDVNIYFGADDNYLSASKVKGSITFFPSYLLHEVKPVTSGQRLSLVGWVWGPKFK